MSVENQNAVTGESVVLERGLASCVPHHSPDRHPPGMNPYYHCGTSR